MRYLIFAGECYYPSGGARDLMATAIDGVKACETAVDFFQRYDARQGSGAWAHVYDTELGKIVARYGRDADMGTNELEG